MRAAGAHMLRSVRNWRQQQSLVGEPIEVWTRFDESTGDAHVDCARKCEGAMPWRVGGDHWIASFSVHLPYVVAAVCVATGAAEQGPVAELARLMGVETTVRWVEAMADVLVARFAIDNRFDGHSAIFRGDGGVVVPITCVASLHHVKIEPWLIMVVHCGAVLPGRMQGDEVAASIALSHALRHRCHCHAFGCGLDVPVAAKHPDNRLLCISPTKPLAIDAGR